MTLRACHLWHSSVTQRHSTGHVCATGHHDLTCKRPRKVTGEENSQRNYQELAAQLPGRNMSPRGRLQVNDKFQIWRTRILQIASMQAKKSRSSTDDSVCGSAPPKSKTEQGRHADTLTPMYAGRQHCPPSTVPPFRLSSCSRCIRIPDITILQKHIMKPFSRAVQMGLPDSQQ